MSNYVLDNDEVILLNLMGSLDEDIVYITLTSKKIILEQDVKEKKGLFRSETKKVLLDTIMLDTIKTYNGKVQVEQKGSIIFIQTTNKNYTFTLSSFLDASKFVTKIRDAVTGTTMTDRGIEKVNHTFDRVDSVLGFNTRESVKGVIENGVAGTLLKGIKKKDK